VLGVNLLSSAWNSGVVDFGVTGTLRGKAAFCGSTSGKVTIQPQAPAGTYNFNLPTTAGTSGQALVSGDGSSTAMSWADVQPLDGDLTAIAALSGTGIARRTGSNV
jgi:hypothetical protein